MTEPNSTAPADPHHRRRAALVIGGFAVLVAAGLGTAIAIWHSDRPGSEPVPVVLGPKEPPVAVKTVHDPDVKAAIEKAVTYLKKRLLEEKLPKQAYGAFSSHKHMDVGIAALMGTSLLAAGTPTQDPAVQKALALVHQFSPKIDLVYVQACALFLLNRLHVEGDLDDKGKKLVRTLALRMIAGQTETGQWTYLNPPISDDKEKKLLEKLVSGKFEPTVKRSSDSSNSMTQFAMLALWSARKCDVPVRAPLMKAALQFHGTQQPKGEWHYNAKRFDFDDSNTCAGLLGLAIEQALRQDQEFAGDKTALPPANPKVAEMRARAFARLAQVIGRSQPPPKKQRHAGKMFYADALGDIYFLWCVERVAVIYGMERIENKDWYQWGRQWLLDTQAPLGSWTDRYGPEIDTAFAVLFLTRANLAKDLIDKLQELLRLEMNPRPDLPSPRKE